MSKDDAALIKFLVAQRDEALDDELFETAGMFNRTIDALKGYEQHNRWISEDNEKLAEQLQGKIDKINIPCSLALDEIWARIMPQFYGPWDYPAFASRHIIDEHEAKTKFLTLLEQMAFNACVVVDTDGDPHDDMHHVAMNQLRAIVDVWRKEVHE